ncbi:MAG: FRG domain-containing protein [Candidatus Binataceae bacterium]
MRAREPNDGVVLGIDVKSWQEFAQTLKDMSLGDQYVFRGQACDLWELRPSLSRLFRDEGLLPQDAWTLAKQHFQRFEECVRNIKRRVQNIDISTISDEDLWLLGQHYGLQTPILDWTRCPFIAAFFAFTGQPPGKADACFEAWKAEPWRCVWAARKCSINQKFSDYEDPTKAFRLMRFFDPKTYFQRIRDQRGLFSLGPTLDCVEHMVKANFKGCETPVLIQIRPVLIQIRIDDPTETFVKDLEYNNHLTKAIMLDASINKDLEEVASYCNCHLKSALITKVA